MNTKANTQELVSGATAREPADTTAYRGRTSTADQLRTILDLHSKWLRGYPDGVRADLTGDDLTDVDLNRANLTRAILVRTILTRANLTGANLTEANLKEANLTEADLTLANLTEANLRSSNLTRAVLTCANLTRTNLNRANMTRANLTRADLFLANLNRANLTGTDLTDAKLTHTKLPSANLTDTVFSYPVTGVPNIKELVLSRISDGCYINMRILHGCQTMRCLAGWITTVHPEGKLLEYVTSTNLAAHLILKASGIESPDFYDISEGCDERAMNWLRCGTQS